MTAAPTPGPYRVVDASNQGWHPTGTRDAILWAADYGFQRDLEDRSYAELEASRGPLRPVEPVTDDDVTELHRLFSAAGRKTVTTLAAALESVFHDLREERGGHVAAAHDSWEYAKRTMMAGREGSWESECLTGIVLFGNELNLAKETRDCRDVYARRAAGPVRRVDPAARDAMAVIVRRWVTDPARYTEVAETLASVVSRYCDGTGGEHGWRAVADQWLQPGGLALQSFSICYRLLYSQSEHFNPSLI